MPTQQAIQLTIPSSCKQIRAHLIELKLHMRIGFVLSSTWLKVPAILLI